MPIETAPEVIKVKRETFDDIKARLTAHNPEDDSWEMLGGEICLNGIAVEAETPPAPEETDPLAVIANGIMQLRRAFFRAHLAAPKAIILGRPEDKEIILVLDHSRHVFVHVDATGQLDICGVPLLEDKNG